MPAYGAPVWKKAPFLRLLPAFALGIILQWYMQLPLVLLCTILAIAVGGTTCFLFLSSFNRYRFAWLQGLLVTVALATTGALLAWHKDVRHIKNWIGNDDLQTDIITATLTETPIEKTKSIKATATITARWRNRKQIATTATIIIYFKKDSSLSSLTYGTSITFKRPLQEIRSTGNPGGFDYKRYSLFNGITHQVYLQPGEFAVNPATNVNRLRAFIIHSREWVLKTLRTHITDTTSLGLAEALLIGYKDDLDKTLVQSYTNTGVVHVIAISGLHLGLIYWLLSLPFRSLKRKKKWKWLPPLVIITGLWLFTLLAGAQPSVLRSAVMFSCIVIGESLSRRTSIFNTLAASAFLLLCINPYWLWDAGFQLSYSAVLSIIIFQRPIYNWFYFRNKAIDLLWQLNAVTIAAQILTLPVCLYHFHQFPNYFILANMVAVPLSSVVLIGEIALCVFAVIPMIASWIAVIIEWNIRIMNNYITTIEKLPYAIWPALQINVWQAIALLFFAAAAGYWLMERSVTGLKIALLCLVWFTVLRTTSFIQAGRQQKLIIYNIPHKTAIDLIEGRHYYFIGDSSITGDPFIRNFHLQPSRTMYRATGHSIPHRSRANAGFIQYNSKHILLLDRHTHIPAMTNKQTIDLLLVSGNPRPGITDLSRRFYIRQVVFDASVSRKKIDRWKTECDSLRIAWHDVATKGAFVMNLR